MNFRKYLSDLGRQDRQTVTVCSK